MGFRSMSPSTPFSLATCAFVVLAGPAVAQNPIGLTAEQACEDVQLAIDVVEAALPDIYWRQSPETWAQAKARALAQCEGVDDPMQVYAVLAPLLTGIGEGHLAIYPGRVAAERQRRTAAVLPLDLHWSAEGIFVIATYGDAADVPAGSRLLSINGDGYDALLRELLATTPHDGDIATGAMRSSPGGRYAVLRQRMRGNEAAFVLRYVTPEGEVSSRTVDAFPLAEHPAPNEPEGERASLEWLAPGLAYLVVPTFSNSVYRKANTTFRAEMERLFADLRRGRATRLILDLRENGGGSEPNESILYSFLVAAPLHKYETVEARGRNLSVTSRSGRTFTRQVFDEDEMNFQRVLLEGRLARLNVPPEGLMSHWEAAEPLFEGRLAVLAGGATFSGGAELASMLRHVGRGVFVGEEVGGTHEGNTSGYSWSLELPNSGTRLHVPLLRFRFAWPGLPRNRGVQPDCAAPPLVGEVGVRRDRAWRIARAVVEQDWTRPEDAVCPAAPEAAT